MEQENVDFNFEGDFFTEKEINLEKLQHMDKIKAERSLKHIEIKKEMRTQTRMKRKENKKKIKSELDEKMSKMTLEERKEYFDNKKLKELNIEENLNKGLTSKWNIIFDLDYLHLMKKREVKSLASQLAQCYKLNKISQHPFCYHICSYVDLIKEEMNSMGAHNWKVKYYDKPFYEVEEFEMENYKYKQLVYLSPDSSNVLEKICEEEVYIIGGFVDKPVSKHQSLYKANNLNIKTARLPLDVYLKNLANPVLNVNSVVEMMSKFLECGGWDDAITSVIPKRMFE
jgi:Trm5-related predicted tRNA methylase